MDQIIFYKQDHNLKSTLEQLRFSYDRPYAVYFVSEYDQLSTILTENFSGLFFFISNKVQEPEKARLRYLSLNYPHLSICLCSDSSQALDAWKLNLFHFETMPVNGEVLLNTYKKFIAKNISHSPEITLKNDDGIIKISIHNITYLQASGNYTTIVMKNNKTLLQTKQLGTFEPITEQDIYFKRIHRSLIVNLRQIQSVIGNKIYFYHQSNPLEISKTLEVKLKRLLLGASI